MKLVDLTGRRYGKLTVLERAADYVTPKGAKEPQWLCQCDCGNTTIVNGRNLKQGHTKSCGCLAHEHNSRFIDLTGQTFGKLTVLHEAGHTSKKGGQRLVQWRCRCECGREITVRGESLRSGNTQSCGQCKYENRYEFYDGYVIGYTNTGDRFFIDREDYEKVSPYYWRKDKHQGYIETFIRHKRLPLHRFIMDAEKGEIIDHINHQKNDNRKVNLRKVTPAQNAINRKLRVDNHTGCAGVVFRPEKGRKPWYVTITVNKEVLYLGRFLSFEEAEQARRSAEKKYFGEYSYTDSIAAVPCVVT